MLGLERCLVVPDTTEMNMASFRFFRLSLGEDLGAVLEVEGGEVLGGEDGALVLVRRRQHRREQGAGARPGDHVEVVRDPSVRAVQLLQ